MEPEEEEIEVLRRLYDPISTLYHTGKGKEGETLLKESSEGQRIEFGDVTVLIGPNGAGKSNFISFFRMINKMMDGDLRLYVGTNGKSPSFLYFGPEETPSLSAEIVFSNDKDANSYRFSLAHTAEDTFVFNNEEIAYKKGELPEERTALQTIGLSESMIKRQSWKAAGTGALIFPVSTKRRIAAVYGINHAASSTATVAAARHNHR